MRARTRQLACQSSQRFDASVVWNKNTQIQWWQPAIYQKTNKKKRQLAGGRRKRGHAWSKQTATFTTTKDSDNVCDKRAAGLYTNITRRPFRFNMTHNTKQLNMSARGTNSKGFLIETITVYKISTLTHTHTKKAHQTWKLKAQDTVMWHKCPVLTPTSLKYLKKECCRSAPNFPPLWRNNFPSLLFIQNSKQKQVRQIIYIKLYLTNREC